MFDFLVTNQLARFAILALIFAVVIIGVVSVGRLSARRVEARQNIREIAGGGIGRRETLQDKRTNAWAELAERVERAGLSLADSKGDVLRDKLRAAGYQSAAAPKIFTLLRFILVFAVPLLFLAYMRLLDAELSTFTLYFGAAFCALLGLYLPNLVVTAKADRRREAVTHGFPDCLDLMLVCVEAGLGMEAAMDRVGREMVESHPLIAKILSEVTLQLRAGARREDALRKMGESSGVVEIRSFATLLIQSDKLGTSVADTLRVYSAEMREKRRLRAEEKAHRLPVLISIPLVVNMLPTMIGVLMMPGMIRVFRELIPAMGGG
ncbi:type II secretion system F family protein [Qipengyuania sp. XHP0211]|uniref:type II secretion system F family protein n=1 Tax=Qipengyuania sp. XHP0211 TaxID=3038079 RepID=UPI00241E9722|nr:type II secretion system F family protein [Qipengyuania sp. XHP0211]MDG5752297.1 type II secretion system F family protein [Qipengyuania sp. XHP0211]